jgi:hypothetical protein
MDPGAVAWIIQHPDPAIRLALLVALPPITARAIARASVAGRLR